MYDKVVMTIECWHVPKMKRNLISLSTLDTRAYKYQAENGVLKACKGSTVLMKGNLTCGLYVLQDSVIFGKTIVASGSSVQNLTHVWHLLLGHVNEKMLSVLGKQNLLRGHKDSNMEFCEHCMFGKNKTVVHSIRGKLDYIHSDLCGLNKLTSKNGARYFMTLIYDYSRMVFAYFLKIKDEALLLFIHWKTMVEKQTKRMVKRFRTNNGLKFYNRAFNKFCNTEGTVRHRTCANHQNRMVSLST